MTLAVVAHQKNFPVVAYFFYDNKTKKRVKGYLNAILILSKFAIHT